MSPFVRSRQKVLPRTRESNFQYTGTFLLFSTQHARNKSTIQKLTTFQTLDQSVSEQQFVAKQLLYFLFLLPRIHHPLVILSLRVLLLRIVGSHPEETSRFTIATSYFPCRPTSDEKRPQSLSNSPRSKDRNIFFYK